MQLLCRDGTQKHIVLMLVNEFLKHDAQLIYESNQGKDMCGRTMGRSTKYINRELTKYQTMSFGKKYVLEHDQVTYPLCLSI